MTPFRQYLRLARSSYPHMTTSPELDAMRGSRKTPAQPNAPELDAWFSRKTPAQPTLPDLNERFRDVTDAIDAKLNTFARSQELMFEMVDKRLESFEEMVKSRLPPLKTQAKKHDVPLFTKPP